jgi:DNA-binding GntR family transcriptional regulator
MPTWPRSTGCGNCLRTSCFGPCSGPARRIFDLSPLAQIRKEVGRLWQMSDIYSAAWWRRQPEAKKRIGAEHRAIISSLRRFDLDKLVEICAMHRTGGLERSLSGGYW